MATKTKDRFEVDFTPYPRVLKSTQRSMYRNNQEMINDIVDDSIDGRTTDVYIDIGQYDKKPLLTISDNGWGMDLEPKDLFPNLVLIIKRLIQLITLMVLVRNLL